MMPETVAIVGERQAGQAAKALKEVNELVSSMRRSEFDIAEKLAQVQKNGWYRPNFETFNEYAESIEKDFDFSKSKVYYLARIAGVMEEVGIERNTYEPLGTTRLREITSLDPQGTWTNPNTGEETPIKDLITEMVNKGETIPIDELRTHVRTIKGLIGDNDIVNDHFGWTRAAFENTIEPAIEMGKRHVGSAGRDEDGNAIEPSRSRVAEFIFGDWLSDPKNHVTEEM